MRRLSPLGIVALALLSAAPAAFAKKDRLPRFPNAQFLTGYPPFSLILTTPSRTLWLQHDGRSGWYVIPTISSDGRVVASARPAPGDPPRSTRLLAATRSTGSGAWVEIPSLPLRSGAVAISPDGSKLACVTRWRYDAPSRLRVLDLRTGRVLLGPEVLDTAGTDISWAPDSRHLAFDMGDNGSPVKSNPSPLRAIYLLDVDTGTVRRLRTGVAPSWSPSGAWIAYLDYFPDHDSAHSFAAPHPNRLCLMRADGSDPRVLLTFPPREDLRIAPVWSPDSQAILINRWRDRQKGTMDLYTFNLSSHRVTRMRKDVLPVYAWLPAR